MSDPRDARPGEAVANLVDSALRLSASVAQVVAEAASGRPQANRPGDTPLQSIVRHGTTAVGSLVGAVVAAARTPRGAPAAEPGGAAPGAAAPAPVLAAGGSLRLPLSVHNPGDAPMVGISARLGAIRREGVDRDGALAVGFAPEALTVAPHDFEKLTVTVAAPEGTEPGFWEVQFALTGQDEPVTIRLEVARPEAA